MSVQQFIETDQMEVQGQLADPADETLGRDLVEAQNNPASSARERQRCAGKRAVAERQAAL
jgi:hypothetical protein